MWKISSFFWLENWLFLWVSPSWFLWTRNAFWYLIHTWSDKAIQGTVVPLYRCTVVPLYRCTEVPLYRCTVVPLYRCESRIAMFARRVTWNYAYSPFKEIKSIFVPNRKILLFYYIFNFFNPKITFTDKPQVKIINY